MTNATTDTLSSIDGCLNAYISGLYIGDFISHHMWWLHNSTINIPIDTLNLYAKELKEYWQNPPTNMPTELCSLKLLNGLEDAQFSISNGEINFDNVQKYIDYIKNVT